MFLFRLLTIISLLCLFVASSWSYKILLVPLVQGSHVSCFVSIARELGRRQHETHILVDADYKVDEDTATDAKKLNITFVQLIPSRNSSVGETKGMIGEV